MFLFRLMDGAETRRSLLSAEQVFGISSLTSPSEFNVIAVGKEVSLIKKKIAAQVVGKWRSYIVCLSISEIYTLISYLC